MNMAHKQDVGGLLSMNFDVLVRENEKLRLLSNQAFHVKHH
jgi:hypothetical protein